MSPAVITLNAITPVTAALVLVLLAAAWLPGQLRAARRRRTRLVEALGSRPAARLEPRGIHRARAWTPGAVLLLLAGSLYFAPERGAGVRVGADLVVCLDVSRSMLARDAGDATRLSRLARAKKDLRALCDFATGDRFALVLFAGSAQERVPPTSDLTTLAEIAAGAAPEDIALGGTDLAAALDLAGAILVRLDSEGQRPRGVLLVTDGEDPDGGGRQAASRLGETGIPVHCIGIGTPTGAKIPIPAADGGETFLQDDAGNDVITALVAGDLAALADAGAGRFLWADPHTGGDANPFLQLYRAEIQPAAERLARSRPGAPTAVGGRAPWWLALAIALACGSWLLRDRASEHAPRPPAPRAAGGPDSRRAKPGPLRSGAAAIGLLSLLLGGSCTDPRGPEAEQAWRRGDLVTARDGWAAMLAGYDWPPAGTSSGNAPTVNGNAPPAPLVANLAIADALTQRGDGRRPWETVASIEALDPNLRPTAPFVAGILAFREGRNAARATLTPGAPPEAYGPAIGMMETAAGEFMDAALAAADPACPWATTSADHPNPHWPAAIRNAERAHRIATELRRMRELAARDRKQVNEQQRQVLLQMLGTEGGEQEPPEGDGTGEGDEVAPETAPDPGALSGEQLQALLDRLQEREAEKRSARRERREAATRARRVRRDW